MKFSLPFVLFFLLFSSHYAAAENQLSKIADRLEKVGCYRAEVTFGVLLPNAEAPVEYSVALESFPMESDTLYGVSYHIVWTPDTAASRIQGGFSAYYDGNYFRYSDGRLQENHAADNPVPFAPRGDKSKGVQSVDRHATLLPRALAAKLSEMTPDNGYDVQVATSADKVVVSGSQSIKGYLISEFTYEFDHEYLPLRWEIVSNPGEMSEQTVTAVYRNLKPDCPAIDEKALISAHPDEFDKFRRDSFSLMSLPGSPLPSINVATLDGKRYVHHRGEALGHPLLLMVTDSSVDGGAQTLKAIRSAIASLPFTVDLVIAFSDADADAAAELVGGLADGENVLRNARAVVRDCGVVDFPSLIFVSPDGTVNDIQVGRNNHMRQIVINKVMKSMRGK